MEKKKVEVLFKAMIQTGKTDEAGVKATLEEVVPGLKTKSVKVFVKDSNIKAVVSSNILSLVSGESDFSTTCESASLRVNRPLMIQGSKEIEKLKQRIKELEDQSKKDNELKRDSLDMGDMFQEQVTLLSKQIEKLDVEKNALENKNRELKAKVEEFSLKLAIRAEAKTTGNSKNNDRKDELAALEKYIAKKQKEFEMEKTAMQDKINAMSLKLINEKGEGSKLIEKSNKVELLEKALTSLQIEYKALNDSVREKDRIIKEKEGMYNEVDGKREALGKELKEKGEALEKMEEKIKEVEKQAKQIEEQSRINTTQKKEIELLKKEVYTLNKEKDDLKSNNEELSNDLAEKVTIIEQFKVVSEKINEELAQTKQALNENVRNDINNSETIRLKDAIITKLQEDLKTFEEQISFLKGTSNSKKDQHTQTHNIITVQDSQVKTNEMIINTKDTEKQTEGSMQEVKAESKVLNDEIVKELEKKLRLSKEERNKLEHELNLIKVRLDVTEKVIGSKTEEIKHLNSLLGITKKEVDLQSKPEQDSKELASLQVELNKVKKEVQNLTKDSNKKKANMKSLKGKGTKSECIETLKEDLEGYRIEIESLRAINDCLRVQAEQNITNIEDLKSQNENLIKENNDLKVVLVKTESSVRSSSTGTDNFNTGETKKLQTIEQAFTDVVYAYKTLTMQAKELTDCLKNKKEKIVVFLNVMDKLTKINEVKEQLEIIEMLESELEFLKGFPPNTDPKLKINCLTKVANRRNKKIAEIEKKISNKEALVELLERKVLEYEHKFI